MDKNLSCNVYFCDMSIQDSYNAWASQYDTNKNNTRDLEAYAIRTILQGFPFSTCLEIGCGTGKNTSWFIQQANETTSVDFSEAMLAKAKIKINSDKVSFIQADINEDWPFKQKYYDLVSFSLVLEHIENLDIILRKAANVINSKGYVYIGELHPFKQYTGSKARFETATETINLECYTHHISDYVQAAKQNGFDVVLIDEFFDDESKKEIPRILCLLLQKI
jgi:ubiquinone/menaquinone biosynthesis C-methylase UbiE